MCPPNLFGKNNRARTAGSYQVNSSTLENCYGKNCCLRCVLKHKLRLNRATLYHEEGDRTRLSNKLVGQFKNKMSDKL